MKKLIVGFIALVGSYVFAHGSDKPGPHGGFVEMPGAFHAEVVPVRDGSFKVYLIDINFKNPTIKDSTVDAWIEANERKTQLRCEAVLPDHFQCFPDIKFVNAKELIIKAKRDKAQGNEVEYKLPLKRHD